MITLQSASNWGVVTPTVFRYEDECWIDEFFESGKIRLGSFSRFATYTDPARGDPNEGSALCHGIADDGSHSFVVQSQGTNAAVLCCSHRLDRDLRLLFGRNSAFCISNTVAFGFEIARHLPGFRQGMEGSCIYRSDASIRRQINPDGSTLQSSGDEGRTDPLSNLAAQLGGAELLLLKNKVYEQQQEYRLLWELDFLKGDHVYVEAPLARRFCRRVDVTEWE